MSGKVSNMQGRIVAVCTSKKKGERKVDVGTALLIEGLGMEGDARALRLHTQATLEGRRLREVRWRLQPGRDGDELRYGSDGWAEEVVVAKGPFRNARFEYLGPGEAWLSRWAPGADETVRLPRAVMFSADGPNGPVTWIAAIQARRAPETLKLPEGIGL